MDTTSVFFVFVGEWGGGRKGGEGEGGERERGGEGGREGGGGEQSWSGCYDSSHQPFG